MENRKRNVTALGLLVVVAGILFVWGMFFLMGNPFWRDGFEVELALEDGGGLKAGSAVRLHGVDVGTVRRVRLAPPRRVVARLWLEERVHLPVDTRAAVRGDVFGTFTVELVPGEAVVALQPGDTVVGIAARGLPDLVSELGDRAQAVLTDADSLLSPRAVADVHATASVLPASAEALRAAFTELHLAARSLRRSAEEVEAAEAGPTLGRALTELEGSARAFTSAANAMEESLGSLSSVLGKIDRGEGTLGKLVNDTLLYQEMSSALREMRALAADVRERPKRYVDLSIF